MSLYSMIFKPSIRSKCLRFNVAKGKLFEMAVAAIKRSAMPICLRFLLSTVFISTAACATASSKGITLVLASTLFQKESWAVVAPE